MSKILKIALALVQTAQAMPSRSGSPSEDGAAVADPQGALVVTSQVQDIRPRISGKPINKDVLDSIIEFLDPTSYLNFIKANRGIRDNAHLSFDAFSKTQSQANFLIITNKYNIERESTTQIPAGLQSFLSHINDDHEPIHMALIADENHPLIKTTKQNVILIPQNQSVVPEKCSTNKLIIVNASSIQDCFLKAPENLTSTSTLIHVAFHMQSLTSIGRHFLSDSTSLTSFDSTGMTSLTSIGNNFLADCTSLTSFDSTQLFKRSSNELTDF